MSVEVSNRRKNDMIKCERPIRVLHYIGSLNYGGSQAMIMNIYRNIDRDKIQFDFIVDRKNEKQFAKEIESLGGRVFIFDEFFKGYNYVRFTRQWREFLHAHPEYRIFHCHVRSVASIVLRIAKKKKLITICHSHNTSNGNGIKAIVKKILQGSIKGYCDYFFACSKDAAIWLYGKRVANSERCIIVSNAIEIKNFKFNQKYRDEIRKEIAIDNKTYLVGHVGRFEEQKNHSFIIELIDATKGDKDIVFALCGDGSLKDDFQNRIKELKLEKKVLYMSGTKDIYKYYDAFDYFILPSRYEGLGMVLIEAQFSGLDCLASPNVPEEARISENYVVEDLEVDKWKKIILEKKKNNMRENVRLFKNAKRFDVTLVAKELQEFYIKCAGELKH